jgi:hypothetical protein
MLLPRKMKEVKLSPPRGRMHWGGQAGDRNSPLLGLALCITAATEAPKYLFKDFYSERIIASD